MNRETTVPWATRTTDSALCVALFEHAATPRVGVGRTSRTGGALCAADAGGGGRVAGERCRLGSSASPVWTLAPRRSSGRSWATTTGRGAALCAAMVLTAWSVSPSASEDAPSVWPPLETSPRVAGAPVLPDVVGSADLGGPAVAGSSRLVPRPRVGTSSDGVAAGEPGSALGGAASGSVLAWAGSVPVADVEAERDASAWMLVASGNPWSGLGRGSDGSGDDRPPSQPRGDRRTESFAAPGYDPTRSSSAGRSALPEDGRFAPPGFEPSRSGRHVDSRLWVGARPGTLGPQTAWPDVPAGTPWLGTSPWLGTPFGVSPWSVSPLGVSPLGWSPLGVSPWGVTPWTTSPLWWSPFGVSPFLF